MSRVDVVETNLEFNNALQTRSETNFFVIHHIGDINRDVSAEEIHRWHQEAPNYWSGIGYHYVIRKDGTIERGRPRTAIGSHCYGFNRESTGINVVGDFDNFEPEQAQIESLVLLLADLMETYGLEPSRDTIRGHKDQMVTECPGENLYAMLDEIVERVKNALKGE
jgi:N-acetylmuramoyl-L-alanine amidase